MVSTFLIAIVVVVVGAKISGKLLQGSEMSLALFSGSLALFHNEPKQLGHGRFRGWWWLVLARSAAMSACHPGVCRIIRGKAKRVLTRKILVAI